MNTAVAIVGYNRVQYFERTVYKVALNLMYTRLPVYVYLDYTPETCITDQMIRIVQALIPDAFVIVRESNLGCDRNCLQSLKDTFSLGYDRVIYIEEDTVPSKYGFTLLENMMDQLDSEITGSVQLWEYNLCTTNADLNAVRITLSNFWCTMFKKECWDSVLPLVNPYIELSKKHRDPCIFSRWIKDIHPKEGLLPEKQADAIKKSEVYGWDGFLQRAMLFKGWNRYATCVPRCENIGREGFNSFAQAYDESKLGSIRMYENKSDLNRKDFVEVL